jgi:cell wall-associated NlpC family hydrolase
VVLPITGTMSLDATLARISALENAFSPQTVAPAAATATPAVTGTSGATNTTFATQLQGAMATDAVSPATGGGGAAAIVRIAEGEVGQAEQPPGSNDSPRIAMYRTATAGAAAGEPWCAYFVSWVAHQAGVPIGDNGQGLGYCGDIWSWAQRTGRAIPNGSGVRPQPGDLILFGDHHVGIVEQVNADGSIQTIEGNYSDKVSRVTRGAGEATGYVRLA